jgi:hypothetical protein
VTRVRLVVMAAVFTLAACTGGGGDNGEAAGNGSAAENGAPTGSTGSSGEQVGEGVVAAAVELTAPPEEDAGEVPTFAWESVEGAAAYRLVVLDAEGRAVWAWEGSETSVALGGVPDRPEGAEGPVLTAGSTWSVAALDADGHVVAVSTARPASP